MVLGMKILEYCKGYSFVDVNHIYDMSSNMYNYVRLRGDLFNRWQHRALSNIWYQKVYLYLVCDKSWKVCPEHSNEVTDMSLYNSIYYTESVTTIIHDLNYIHFMQKILYVCLHIYMHYLSKEKGQLSWC